MLTKQQVKEIREELDNCKRPVFYFDDDEDGLCSFLLFYKYKREGIGIPVKSNPSLVAELASKALRYGADKVFILDKPLVDQEFLDAMTCPVIWIDHHPLVKREKVKYYNPLQNSDKTVPTTYCCYQVVDGNLWLGTLGCIGDHYLPDFAAEFSKKYPDLLPVGIKSAADALFDTNIGKLARIFAFVLKGEIKNVRSCINTLTRIEDPYEILTQSTPAGNFIYKRFEKVNQEYESLLHSVRVNKGEVIVFRYIPERTSFTGDLANELAHKYPKNVIVVAREKSDKMICSIRSSKYNLPKVIGSILESTNGYGGGHAGACGGAVPVESFDEFIKQLQAAVKKLK